MYVHCVCIMLLVFRSLCGSVGIHRFRLLLGAASIQRCVPFVEACFHACCYICRLSSCVYNRCSAELSSQQQYSGGNSQGAQHKPLYRTNSEIESDAYRLNQPQHAALKDGWLGSLEMLFSMAEKKSECSICFSCHASCSGLLSPDGLHGRRFRCSAACDPLCSWTAAEGTNSSPSPVAFRVQINYRNLWEVRFTSAMSEAASTAGGCYSASPKTQICAPSLRKIWLLTCGTCCPSTISAWTSFRRHRQKSAALSAKTSARWGTVRQIEIVSGCAVESAVVFGATHPVIHPIFFCKDRTQ